MVYSKCNENTKTQRVFLIEILLLDEQLSRQLNRICSMVTLDMKVVSGVAGVHGPAPEGDTQISVSPCVSLLSQG